MCANDLDALQRAYLCAPGHYNASDGSGLQDTGNPVRIPDWAAKYKDEIISHLNQLHTLDHKDKPRELKNYVVYMHNDIIKHHTLEFEGKEPCKLKDYVVHLHNDIIEHHTLEIEGKDEPCKIKDFMVKYVDDRVGSLTAYMQTVLDAAMHIQVLIRAEHGTVL